MITSEPKPFTLNIVTGPPAPDEELLRIQFNVWVRETSVEVYAESEDHCKLLGDLIADTLHRYLRPGTESAPSA